MDSAALLASIRGGAPDPHLAGRRAIDTVYRAGHYLLEQGRIEDAAKVLRVMVKAAPTDERSWLALGMCHERHGQPNLALELYGVGAVAAVPGVRCQIARVRLLRSLGRDDEADAALEAAEAAAGDLDDDDLLQLVAAERRGAS